MRKNRNSDVVTSSHQNDSDEEQEQSVDDSEEDWKPEKKKGAVAKGGPKRKSTGAGTPKGRGKKSKKEESEEESEEEEDDEDDDDLEEDDESDEESGGKGKKGGAKKARLSVGKNQPDKDGNMELYLFKNDLTKDFRSDEKLCMWRRDGASLLQKYMVVTDESTNNDIIFKASSVYSCWEEKRKNDFFQIKVQLIGDKKEGKVKVVDIAEFEQFAKEDRPKVDITPKGAEGGENYEENSEEEYDENEEEED